MTDQNDLRNADLFVPPITDAEANSVRRHIATHARDKNDALLLMAALGLDVA